MPYTHTIAASSLREGKGILGNIGWDRFAELVEAQGFDVDPFNTAYKTEGLQWNATHPCSGVPDFVAFSIIGIRLRATTHLGSLVDIELSLQRDGVVSMASSTTNGSGSFYASAFEAVYRNLKGLEQRKGL
ncbi:MAG: hypothetical protein ABIA93_03495 [Candidatus Woesearchaeota archaeon]